MKVAILFFGLMSLASASAFAAPEEIDVRASCGTINGDCNKNNCNGNTQNLVCTSGNYKGCQCGFGCNGAGPCNQNGCNGRVGRCTGNYLGCSCV